MTTTHLRGTGPKAGRALAGLAWINGLLAICHFMLRAEGDGGRVVRALAWARSGGRTRAGDAAAHRQPPVLRAGCTPASRLGAPHLGRLAG